MKGRKKTPKVAGFMREILAANVRSLMEAHFAMSGNKPGGQGKWKHASKKSGIQGHADNKKVVLGMLQRGGELRLVQLPRRPRVVDIKAHIQYNIESGSKVYTDEAAHYKWMETQYGHALVKHFVGEYTRGDITTNRIEGVFGHFKRMVHGTYHKISDQHLDRYLQMFAYRWNRRDMGEGERVNDLLKRTRGSRITYNRLTRKDQ